MELIRKDRVIERAIEIWDAHDNGDDAMQVFIDWLREFADGVVVVEPIKYGQWIRKESKRTFWYECSECGSPPMLNIYKREMFTEYCPNCGARMEEEDECKDM